MKMLSLSSWYFVIALLACSSSVSAGMLFRYTDDSGHVVMARTVPPHIVLKGYEVLNEQGRVVEVVAAAMTDAEKKARDDLIVKKEREAQELKKQQDDDKKLLRQYSGPDDAVVLMQRRLSEVDGVIQSRRASIDVSKKNIGKLEEKAANFQRNGKAVPKRIIGQISAAHNDIDVSESVIEENLHSRAEIVADFEASIKRLETLTGKKASEYTLSH
jgi:hypothetical protein